MSDPPSTRHRSASPSVSHNAHQTPSQARSTSPTASSNPEVATLVATHPSARLSSSPASSPQVVSTPLSRARSVHPEMEHLMHQGFSPGANFFDNDSSEDEDGEETLDFSQAEAMARRDDQRNRQGLFEFPRQGEASERESTYEHRWSEGQSYLTSLPPFNQIPLHDSSAAELEPSSDAEVSPHETKSGARPAKARKMSLTRMGRGKIVYHSSTGNTPRQSTALSTGSKGDESDFGLVFADPAGTGSSSEARQHTRHRSISSVSRNDSILNAHAIIMRALLAAEPPEGAAEARPITEPPARPVRPKSLDTSRQRVKISLPLHAEADRKHPQFVKTPYPFSATSSFPKPLSRPRQDNEPWSEDDVGRIQVQAGRRAGMETRRANSHTGARKGRKWPGVDKVPAERAGSRTDQRSERVDPIQEQQPGVLFLCLRLSNMRIRNKTVTIEIPSSLTTTEPLRSRGGRRTPLSKQEGGQHLSPPVDFDDKRFAEELRAAFKQLAGPFLWRHLSARRLSSIQLGPANCWSLPSAGKVSVPALLAAREGLEAGLGSEPPPFTETALMDLLRSPKSGKARYTWVHWARRVTEWNASTARPKDQSSLRYRELGASGSRGNENRVGAEKEYKRLSQSQHWSQAPQSITAVHFVYGFSVRRVFCALGLVLALSALAALLWIFLGPSVKWLRIGFRGSGERVGPGMLVGLLVFGLGMGTVAGWLWVSWAAWR